MTQPSAHITFTDSEVAVSISFREAGIHEHTVQLLTEEQEHICAHVAALERTHSFRTVLASEKGSRAFGTAHEASDWDVGLIFAPRHQCYFSVRERQETPKWVFGPRGNGGPIDVEIAGYDIVHFARRVIGDDPRAIEIAVSPVVHRADLCALSSLRELVQGCDPVLVASHYLSWAHAHYRKIFDQRAHAPGQMRRGQLKLYGYSLRGILAASWLLQHRAVAQLPCDVQVLCAALAPPEAVERVFLRLQEGCRELPDEADTGILMPYIEGRLVALGKICDVHKAAICNANEERQQMMQAAYSERCRQADLWISEALDRLHSNSGSDVT